MKTSNSSRSFRIRIGKCILLSFWRVDTKTASSEGMKAGWHLVTDEGLPAFLGIRPKIIIPA